jgi:anaerobic selenocysteine-containing dehydrogenase
MATTVHRTCTLCEATCGLTFQVDGDRILSVRPDPQDPISKGYVCPKGIAIAEVHDDPDRLRQPLRRTARGSFAPIAWKEALDEAADGLRRVRDRHGADAVAIYWGNPVIHNHGALLVRGGINKALGTRNLYGAGSQDVSPRFGASYHLYGSSVSIPVPDIDRTDFFLCVGANPVVSNGSVMTAPDMRGRLRKLRQRGGRLVVVDPRHSETAREADEHIAIRPGTDAALLLALAAVIVRSGRANAAAIARDATGWDEIERRLRAVDLAAVARATGVSTERIVRLATEFAERPSSVAYSRIGVCNSIFGTLGTYATDLLNVAAGRLGVAGGAMFASPAIDISRVTNQKGVDGQGRWRSRVRGLPETFGELPSAALVEEMETPGDGRIRALVTFAGNPVLSIPNGKRLAAALPKLEFQVAIDLYVNETTQHADLILPPAWTLAEQHIDLLFPLMSSRNAVRWSPPVVPKRPDERHDWEILLGLAKRLGGGPTGIVPMDLLLRGAGRLGYRWTPEAMVDLMLRTGPHGDRFVPWSRGLSLAKLKRAEHGLDLGPLEPGVTRRVFHRDRKVHLAAEPLLRNWDVLDASLEAAPPAGTLVLIGRRELRTNNSWMHNVPSLVSGAERCLLFVHPKDAADRGIADGDTVAMESRVHRGELRVQFSEDIAPGVVSLPHGWGHAASAPFQRVAGKHPGVSANDWTDESIVEGVVGQSVLNGVPVTLSPRITPAA